MARKTERRRDGAPSVPAQRSRTGCLTCRDRKLKCDEVQPVCGQCTKSNRQCRPAEGITFRHQQNAGIAGNDGSHSLKGFYKDRSSFTIEQKRSFLPIPQLLTFVMVDPTAEESPPPAQTPATDAVQQVAAHSLEALSTAADISYTPQQVQHAAYYTATAPSVSHPEYGFVRPENVGGGLVQPGNNIQLILNPSHGQTHSHLIDPTLDASVVQVGDTIEAMEPLAEEEMEAEREAEIPEEDRTESRVALLRTFTETPA